MRFFCGSIVGDVLTSSCIAYTLRCSVRRRLTTTEKSLFLERPLTMDSAAIKCPTCFQGLALVESVQAMDR